jgi:hypothetical protein
MKDKKESRLKRPVYNLNLGLDKHLVKIHGFDPLKLLNDIEFPTDKFNVLLKKYASFRKVIAVE